jgi:hypothetical protein
MRYLIIIGVPARTNQPRSEVTMPLETQSVKNLLRSFRLWYESACLPENRMKGSAVNLVMVRNRQASGFDHPPVSGGA